MLCCHYICPFQSVIGFESGPTNALFLYYILFPTGYYLITSSEFKFEALFPSWLSSTLGHTMQILLCTGSLLSCLTFELLPHICPILCNIP